MAAWVFSQLAQLLFEQIVRSLLLQTLRRLPRPRAEFVKRFKGHKEAGGPLAQGGNATAPLRRQLTANWRPSNGGWRHGGIGWCPTVGGHSFADMAMPNYARRTPAVQDEELVRLIKRAPRGVQWKRDSWVTTRIDLNTELPVRRYFFAKTIGYEEALRRAIDWRDGKPVPEQHHARAAKPAHARKLALSRRIMQGGIDPIYELSIQPGKAEGKHAWMRITLGSSATLTQERIDDAIATLVARLDRFTTLARIDRASAVREAQEITITVTSTQERLRIVDVLTWSGRGNGVSYYPNPSKL